MMISQRFRASMLNASCSAVSFLAGGCLATGVAGGEEHWLDQAEVAFCLRMRSINTEPTMPRQPTRPTSFCSFQRPFK
jgi:hypothetical protein